MNMSEVPKEYLEDIKNGKKPSQRYYIAKYLKWDTTDLRPSCQIIRSIGEAGNLEAESLRILKSLDIYSEDYENQL